MHLCIAIVPISGLSLCFLHFSNFVFVVRLPLRHGSTEKSAAPALDDNTFVHRLRYRVLFSLSLSLSLFLFLGLFDLFERTRPSGRSNICPPINLHCVLRNRPRSVIAIFPLRSFTRSIAAPWQHDESTGRFVSTDRQIAQFLSSFLKAGRGIETRTLRDIKFTDIRRRFYQITQSRNGPLILNTLI